ncbi:MAG: hypothetical protein ACYC27_10775 [Armatimonadota bacterium]
MLRSSDKPTVTEGSKTLAGVASAIVLSLSKGRLPLGPTKSGSRSLSVNVE